MGIKTKLVGRDSSVSKVTYYWLGGPGIECGLLRAVKQEYWWSEETFLPGKRKAGLVSKCSVYNPCECSVEKEGGKQIVNIRGRQNTIVSSFDPPPHQFPEFLPLKYTSGFTFTYGYKNKR